MWNGRLVSFTVNLKTASADYSRHSHCDDAEACGGRYRPAASSLETS